MSRALALGLLLSVACLAYVLYPLLGRQETRARRRAAAEPRAVTDEEIEAAVRSYRETHPVGGAACPVCGPRPESAAAFCSTCGRRLDGAPAAR